MRDRRNLIYLFLGGISLKFLLQFYHRVGVCVIVALSVFSHDHFSDGTSVTRHKDIVRKPARLCILNFFFFWLLPHLLTQQPLDCLGNEWPTCCPVHYLRRKKTWECSAEINVSLCAGKLNFSQKKIGIVSLSKERNKERKSASSAVLSMVPVMWVEPSHLIMT